MRHHAGASADAGAGRQAAHFILHQGRRPHDLDRIVEELPTEPWSC